MFGLKEMEFRLVTQHVDEALINIPNILKKWGINVFDLKESSIVNDSDGSIVCEVYLFDCECKEIEYEMFRDAYHYEEIIHEGFKTLVGPEEA